MQFARPLHAHNHTSLPTQLVVTHSSHKHLARQAPFTSKATQAQFGKNHSVFALLKLILVTALGAHSFGFYDLRNHMPNKHLVINGKDINNLIEDGLGIIRVENLTGGKRVEQAIEGGDDVNGITTFVPSIYHKKDQLKGDLLKQYQAILSPLDKSTLQKALMLNTKLYDHYKAQIEAFQKADEHNLKSKVDVEKLKEILTAENLLKPLDEATNKGDRDKDGAIPLFSKEDDFLQAFTLVFGEGDILTQIYLSSAKDKNYPQRIQAMTQQLSNAGVQVSKETGRALLLTCYALNFYGEPTVDYLSAFKEAYVSPTLKIASNRLTIQEQVNKLKKIVQGYDKAAETKNAWNRTWDWVKRKTGHDNIETLRKELAEKNALLANIKIPTVFTDWTKLKTFASQQENGNGNVSKLFVYENSEFYNYVQMK